LEVGVEAAVEADHQHGAGRLDHAQAGADAGEREVDGLLAEDALAGPCEALDQVGVGVGRRADHHGVDVVGRLDRVDRPGLGAVLRGKRLGRGGDRVGDRHQPGAGIAGDRAGMDLADAPGAEQAEPLGHGDTLATNGTRLPEVSVAGRRGGGPECGARDPAARRAAVFAPSAAGASPP
jgi:hypothetical protein